MVSAREKCPGLVLWWSWAHNVVPYATCYGPGNKESCPGNFSARVKCPGLVLWWSWALTMVPYVTCNGPGYKKSGPGYFFTWGKCPGLVLWWSWSLTVVPYVTCNGPGYKKGSWAQDPVLGPGPGPGLVLGPGPGLGPRTTFLIPRTITDDKRCQNQWSGLLRTITDDTLDHN